MLYFGFAVERDQCLSKDGGVGRSIVRMVKFE